MLFKSIHFYVVLGILSLCSSLFAASIDYRHEYKFKTKLHTNRVKMANTFKNNIAVSVELKFRSVKERAILDDLYRTAEKRDVLDDFLRTGSEISMTYRWDINTQWGLQPGLPIAFSEYDNTFKPQLRLIYSPKQLSDLSMNIRYRLEIKPTQQVLDNKCRSRYTFNAGYNIQKVRLGIELNYMHAHSDTYILFDNKNTNYETNFVASYKISNWRPWLELGNVSTIPTSDERELRLRFGIAYGF